MATTQRTLNAVVVSAGLMQKTVKVRIGNQQWNSHIRKHFNRTKNLLVHDPRSSLRTGDVISIEPGFRVSQHVRHVVSGIIAPLGTPIEERPPVPTAEERQAERDRKRAAKDERRGKTKDRTPETRTERQERRFREWVVRHGDGREKTGEALSES